MAKFYGPIGYAKQVETSPGVWEEKISERYHYVEVIRNSRRLQSASQVNDDIDISNEFSIVADPYANQNFHNMRYIKFRGTKWKIISVDASQYPRLILTAGGIYNGK